MQISAKKGNGIDELLETVLLVAEVAELRANPDKPARGTVIEAHLDRRIGPVATMLVATGTLHVGDIVSCGVAYGKVRSLAKSEGSCRVGLPVMKLFMSWQDRQALSALFVIWAYCLLGLELHSSLSMDCHAEGKSAETQLRLDMSSSIRAVAADVRHATFAHVSGIWQHLQLPGPSRDSPLSLGMRL